MRILMSVIVALLLFTNIATASDTSFKGRDASLHLVFQSGDQCSGIAIGRNTILTAHHCFSATVRVGQLGVEIVPDKLVAVNGRPTTVISYQHDTNDHAIVLVDIEFESTTRVGPPPTQGMRVHYWGNPGNHRMLLREGVVVGNEDNNTLIDINGWFGDSGAGILDRQGRVVGVVIGMKITPDQWSGASLKFMTSTSFTFTREQLSTFAGQSLWSSVAALTGSNPEAFWASE